jgi:ubiquinone/menaquinone biosynthesis C-methylase UbiE
MKLESLQKVWEEFARTDPMWAILMDPSRAGGRWQPEEFFQSGLGEVQAVMRSANEYGIPREHGAALDFGCGVGRTSQALCTHFESVCGVDISRSMLELATRFNQHGARCRYVLNAEDNLGVFDDVSFDCIYSNITLQHMRPRYAARYLREFMRLLKPGGLLAFQLPGRLTAFRPLHRLPFNAYYGLICKVLHPGKTVAAMYGISRDKVMRLLDEHAGQLLEASLSDAAGPEWESYRYLVTRRERAGAAQPGNDTVVR